MAHSTEVAVFTVELALSALILVFVSFQMRTFSARERSRVAIPPATLMLAVVVIVDLTARLTPVLVSSALLGSAVLQLVCLYLVLRSPAK